MYPSIYLSIYLLIYLHVHLSIHIRTQCVYSTPGKFAVLYLFSEDFMSKARRAKPPKGHKKPTDAQIKLRELVRFFLEAKIHEHAVYMVDSLWQHTEVLQVQI